MPGRFRPEVHGLRAIAILLVVIYHVWFGRVSGGVDVFLFISAVLLTGSLVRERISLRKVFSRWSRTFFRLVPTAAVAVALISTTGLLLLPQSMWSVLFRDAHASILYYENWELVSRSTDYYNLDISSTSPFQHFWSLSVQGQVFLLWPVLVSLAFGIAHLLRISPYSALLTTFVMVFFVSFAWSVYSTPLQQEIAYFDTFARLWEFALGAILAMTIGVFRALGRRVRVLMGWVGLAGIVSCGAVLDVQGGFPGYLALWPLVSASLVILAGKPEGRCSTAPFLLSRPVTWIGESAYALYLVHWPVLIYFINENDGERPNVWQGVLLILASLLLSRMLYLLVEKPLRRWKLPRARVSVAVPVIAALMAIAMAPTLAAEYRIELRARDLAASADVNNPGAMALLPAYEDRSEQGAETLPLLTELDDQWAFLPEECTGEFRPSNSLLREHCKREELESESGASVRVLFMGSSHME